MASTVDPSVFKDAVVGGSIPRNLIPAVEKGMREVVERGVLIEGKVVDLEVELYDGKFHAVDSDEASFKMAGARAFMEGFEKGAPVLLEPVMELLISVPTETAGSIFSESCSRSTASCSSDVSSAVLIARVGKSELACPWSQTTCKMT